MADIARGHGGDGGDLPPHGNSDRIPNACEATSKSQRKRGSGKNLNLMKAFEKNGGVALPIFVDDRKSTGTYKFIGPYASMFPRCISNEIDKMIPYHYSCWAAIPDNLRDHIYEYVSHYFDLASLEARDDWRDIERQILRDCARRYADRKHKLGVHFRANGGGDSPDRAKRNPPRGYNVEDWKNLIDNLFNTPGWLRRSTANIENRKKIPFAPLCGTESYAQKRYVKGTKNDEPNAIMVWYETHYRADWEDRGFDGFENEKALQTWHDICDERDRLEGEVGQDGYVDEPDILRRILGETHVYIRGVGLKRSASSLGFSSSRQQSQLQQQTDLIEQLQQQQAESDARVVALLDEQKKMKKQMKKQEKQFKKQMKKMLKEMKNRYPGSTSRRESHSDSDA